jgi:hypothetical protein
LLGLSGWQHGVKCCKPCHLVRCDTDHTAKRALLSMERLLHAITLMGKTSLTKSDVAYLQHAVVDRPNGTGNETFHRFKESVKVRLQLNDDKKKMPEELRGASGEALSKLVVEI